MSKHIAMLCMSLNIGGAETHIFELSKQLQKEGHTVTVFSNGGVYEEALTKTGVRHITAPLHCKNLSALRKSYKILLKEFRKNRPSVVHSHTRISNFIGKLVCRKLKIPMVTTVHFNFRSSFFFRLFSTWGSRALAVSEDLKTYVVDNYGYNPDHVTLTVNGIDMERFSKHDESAFRASLGINPDQKMILLVSRLDKEASVHISHFLRVAPAIFQNAPNTRVVIVGDGKAFDEFKAKADQINRQCGTNYVLLQGARTNIEQYTAAADLFVGISRSALEAMATGLPTILLGNLGYLGLYSEKIRKECIETNLTCRGYPYPTDNDLTELICQCLTQTDLSQNISDGQALVRECFSIETMSRTANQVYNEAINEERPLDFMVSGYYGSRNFGDDLTLKGLTEHLNNAKGTVLSCNPQATSVPENVQVLHRFHLRKIKKAMKQTKVFLLGGGSILQDTTSNRSIFYYNYIMRMALRCHCKTMLYANGIGPITKERNRLQTIKLLNKIDLITVRDADSADLLCQFKVDRPIIVTADDAFSQDLSAVVPAQRSPQSEGKTVVGINFKLQTEATETLKEIANGLKILAEKHSLFYYLIPYHLGQDLPPLQALNEQLPEISTVIQPDAAPLSTIQYAAACDFHICERLHAQIMSTILGKPYLPVDYDPKNRSLSIDIGLEDYLINHDSITADRLINAFEKVIDDKERIKDLLQAYTLRAHETALLNRQYLTTLIGDY